MASADMIVKFSLAGVMLLSVGTSSLVFDVTAGRTAGLIAGTGLLAEGSSFIAVTKTGGLR